MGGKSVAVLGAAVLLIVSALLWTWYSEREPASAQHSSSASSDSSPANAAASTIARSDTGPGHTRVATGELLELRHVLASSDTGASAEGAFVLLCALDPLPTLRLSGITGREGVWTFELERSKEASAWLVCATLAEHKPYARPFPELPEPLQIELERAYSIRGRVSFRIASEAGGFAVLCKESTKMSPATDAVIAALAGGDPEGFSLAWTDHDGRFLFQGLEDGKKYDLIAGGRGAAIFPPIKGVRASDGPVELELSWVFGTIIRLQDAEGGAVRLSSAFRGDSLASWFSSEVRSVRPIAKNDLVLALAGGDPTMFVQGDGSLVVLYLSDASLQSLGPNKASYSIPGYEEKEVTFFSRRIDTGLSEELVVLRKTCSGWGEIELKTLRDESGVVGSCREKGTSGALVLESLDGRRDLIPANLVPGLTTRLDQIPHGRYRIHFDNNRLMRAYPGGESGTVLEIGSEPVRIEFDLRLLAGIEFKIEGSSEWKPDEGLLVVLRRVEVDADTGETVSRGGRMLRVSGPPFCVPYLEPGSYLYKVVSPKPEGSGSRDQEQVILSPGVIHEAIVDL